MGQDSYEYQTEDGLDIYALAKMSNIAEELDEQELSSLGSKIHEQYKADKESRGTKEKDMEDAMDLAMMVQDQKNYPWPNASNIKYPLLTVSALQFGARAYAGVVPASGEVVKTKVIGRDKEGQKRALGDRVAVYENYQLNEEITDWFEGMDQLLHTLPIIGTVFKKIYFNPIKQENVSELIFSKNLIVDNYASSLENAASITQEVWMNKHEMIERIRSNLFVEVDLNEVENISSDVRDDYEDENYQTQNIDLETEANLLLEQHCYLDLDNDGYPEPYIVTIHEASQKVLRIKARYTSGDIEENDKGEILRIEPIHYFVKYDFVPSLDGSFYGLGLGELLKSTNETINSILNQITDAGHMSTLGGGFLGKGIRNKKGSMTFSPGEWKRVDVSGSMLRDNVMPLPVPAPNPVLFQVLGMLLDSGREVASVKDVLTGEMSGAQQSPTTTLALIEQGLKMFNSIFQRIHRSLTKELRLLHNLNKLHLDLEKYQEVTDDPEAKVEDFTEETYNIVPVSDVAMVTDMQKAARAQFLMQFIQDPRINGVEIYTRIFEAMGIEKSQELFAPPPEPQPDPALQLAEAELELKSAQLNLDAQEVEAKIEKIKAETLLTIEKAETEEGKNEISKYKAHLEGVKTGVELEERVSNNNQNQVKK